ncbi:hypothetical protein BDA96_02G092500 [Sorghum bicolor]|uniref:Pectinesterase inhibitor domain-containing protein n=2 Tax=Sorghum bicolor TaxID=4558 RepID=A0A921RNK8_SORBI|nr:hypothetical protein BDA96_02G092500 [Sorghum bicolor]KXG34769.1 hypothetical protein SORBI_3002G089200 [Sorghum bicolor]
MVASLHALPCATLLLLVVLVPHACMCMAASNKTTLQDRCESYAGGDRSSFDYEYCAWTLQRADKEGAATADALGLAVIAARLARATASTTHGAPARGEYAAAVPARCQAAFAAARQDSPLADGDFGLDDEIELAIAMLPPPRPSPPYL